VRQSSRPFWSPGSQASSGEDPWTEEIQKKAREKAKQYLKILFARSIMSVYNRKWEQISSAKGI
jgi:hypothetical protein